VTLPADDLAWLTADEVARRVRTRQISAREVAQAFLARVEALNPALNCFVTISADAALADAAAVDARIARGEDPGRLSGVPLHVKDLVDTKGVRTTFCSFIHEHNVPGADSVSIARLRAAGAILLGKTTTPEFGHMAWTEAPIFGRTANVWDATRSAAGSSGGAAVAAAAGLGPLGVGTCAGGSTRIPAAANGVVGFKQSLGLIPHDMAPETFGNMSYITPMTRSVIDTALMLEVMGGPAPADVHAVALTGAGCVEAVERAADAKGLRVAWRPYLGNTLIDPEVLDVCTRAARVFETFGAGVEEMPDDMPPTEPMWLVISTALWRARFSHLLPQWRERMSPTLVRQMENGLHHTAEDLMRAQLQRTQIFRQVQGWFARHDLLVMPTLTRTALPLREGLFEPIEIAGQSVASVRKSWFPYTHPFNLTGHPAVTVPVGVHSDGLPIGLQIVGRRGADTLVCRAAALMEQARPWSQRKPDLAARV
jgi:aspartyl-tRNA(Asn)/glutamyl-tRNA(Gln) amidotransferase subunit A